MINIKKPICNQYGLPPFDAYPYDRLLLPIIIPSMGILLDKSIYPDPNIRKTEYLEFRKNYQTKKWERIS